MKYCLILLSLLTSIQVARASDADEKSLRDIIRQENEGNKNVVKWTEDSIFVSGFFARPIIGRNQLEKEREITRKDRVKIRPNSETKREVIRLVVSSSGDMAEEFGNFTITWDGSHSKRTGFDGSYLRIWHKINNEWKVDASFARPNREPTKEDEKGIASADPSFVGRWKLNLSKSKVTGETFSYEKRGDKIRFDSHGYTYDFDLSGKDFPEPDGQTVSAREIDAHTWEITHRLKGKTTFTREIAVHGDTLTSTIQMAKTDRTQGTSQTIYTRVSGNSGLFGKWKSTEVNGTITQNLEIATGPKSEITMTFPDVNWICHGKFDGKEYPMTINGVATKMTMTFERAGKIKFKTTLKNSGKPEYVDTWTLSTDGRTLSDSSIPASDDERTELVFERK